MNSVVTVLVLFAPLLLILWLANFADRRRAARPAPAVTPPAVPTLEGEPAPAAPGDLPAVEYASAVPEPSAPAVYPADPAVAPAAPAAAARRGPDDTGTVLAALAYAILILFYLGLIVLGVVIQLVGIAAQGPLGAQMAQSWRQMGIDAASLVGILPTLGAGMWIPAVLGLVVLLRPVRRLIARAIPIDPLSTVHAVALSYIALILVNLITTVAALPQLARVMEQQASQGIIASTIPAVWAQEIFWAIMAVVGVGWLSRRSLGAALVRLGVVLPTGRQLLVGIVAGLVFVPLVVLVEMAANALNFGQDANVQNLSKLLIGPLTQSWFGVVTLGVAAGLGEEAIFRGALQPRFGLLLTSVLFAAMHSTYGFSLSTLVVLLLGLALGLVRQRTNTTTSMVMHAVYNSSLGLLALLNVVK